MTHMHARTGEERPENRDANDQYETPGYVTRALLRHVEFVGRVSEPAAGSGRIVRELRRAGYKVDSADAQRGRDFLKRRAPADNFVTNPPYAGGLDFAFVKRATSLSTGITAMLLLHRFLWSAGRREWLAENPPTSIIVMTTRIKFLFADGTPIKGQFYDHAWFVWGEPRLVGDRGTRIVFEGDDGAEARR